MSTTLHKVGLQESGVTPQQQQTNTTSTNQGGGITYTADQWDAVVACVHAKGDLYALPGERGAGHISQAALQDIVDCSKQQGVDLSGVDLTPYLTKTLSDLRDGLAAMGIIPPVDVLPVFDGLSNLFKFMSAENIIRVIAVVVGVVLMIKGARSITSNA